MSELLQGAAKVFRSLLAWLGVLIGVLSAVSALNHLFDIGLEGFFAGCISFYRQLMGPVYDLLKRIPLPFEISNAALDIFALYLVLFSMAFRASVVPLSDKEYFSDERMKDAEYWTVHAGRMEEPYEDNLLSASENPDGTYTKEMYQLRAPWFTAMKSLLLALCLWPVVTLAPARGLHLAKYVLRSDGKDEGHFVKFGEGMVSKRYLRLTKMRFFLAAQILLLPFGVVLFYVLAKFNPLSTP